jgi:UDP-glucose 4-epimerase
MDVRDRRFLITGGASLIGSHIAERLLEAGAGEVVLFDNYAFGSPSAVEHLQASGRVRLVRGDVLRMNEVLEALEGIDGVFAAAALLTLSIAENPSAGLDVNVRGFATVLEACRWQRVRKVVFSSSVAVYGNALADVVTEETPFQGAGMQPAAALYATSKLTAEHLGALYQQRHGLAFVSLRYSTVYGERQHYRGVNVLYILEAYDRIRRGERPIIEGDGREMHDYVYAGDVGRANVLAMQGDFAGEKFTIATGVGTSVNDLVAMLLRVTGSTLTPEYRADRGRVRSAGAAHVHFSRDKAAKVMGWVPEVGLEEGLARLIAWREGVAVARV